LPELGFSRILKRMEVNFTAETETKLKELAAQSGSGTADELVRDVVEGYLDELAQTREMLPIATTT
jgi:predicted DNA-binding protein